MKLLSNTIVAIAIILIKIGDMVLWLIKSVGKIVSSVVKPIYSYKYQKILKIKSFLKLKKTPPRVKKRLKKPVHKAKKLSYLPFLSLKIRYFFLGVVFSFLLIFLPLLTVVFIQGLPNPNELARQPFAQTTKIYDRNGVLLYEIYINQNRSVVSLSDMPQNLINATIAIEDRDFYKHPGFNLLATLRAAKKTFIDREQQGGSTLTQQLIKSTFLTPEPSIGRKIKEVFLAFWAERLYSKDQILEMYLNQVPYGGTAWGVEAASQTYFGKDVKDLTLAESALLAGLPAAPTIYSPFGANPQYANNRQLEVLEKMVNLSFISDEDAQKAREEELRFKKPANSLRAPHFVLYIKDLLAKKYGLATVEQGGLKVMTTLDLNIQEMTEKYVQEEVDKLSSLRVTNGAALVTDPRTGDILAMVGSKDYFGQNGNFNVTTALRQPGSSIKVVTYAAALEEGFTAANILEDTPATFSAAGAPAYSPVNYDGRFHGRVTLRAALANSYNIPAVKTLNSIGIERMLATGKRLGIKSWDNSNRFGLSLTLGGGEVTMMDLATVYGTLANQGERAELNPILKITDSRENILEEKKIEKHLALDGGVAFILSDILSDAQARAAAFGINSILNVNSHRVSVKTGTSDSKRDNWTIGYTKDIVTAVWVGNNDNSPMDPALTSGITGAAPIWNKIMISLLADKEKDDKQLILPENVIALPCLGRTEYFIRGTEGKVNCRVLPTPTPTPNL